MSVPFSYLPRRRGRGLRRGFSLVEIIFALALMSMVLVIFGATFPSALRGGGQSAAYAQASLLAQHKVDQLRQIGLTHINKAEMTSLGLIDGTTNADGSYPFTLVDYLIDNNGKRGYYGSATSGVKLSQALPSQGANAPGFDRVYQVTVWIQWTGGGVKGGRFETHTIISDHK